MTETDDVVVARVPPRWRPYVVIAAGILLHFTYGIVYTFGNLLPYLVSYLRWKVDPTLSGGSLIWIQSLMAGMPFAMLVGGYMEKRLGARKSAFIGSVLYSGSLALSYLSIQHSFFLLLITFGVMSSFGSSVAYNSVMICCQRWLPTRVGLVNGLITAGYALSAFVAAPLETRFINPLNYPVDSEGHFTQEDLLERVPQMFLLLAALFGTIQVVALLFLGEPVSKECRRKHSVRGGRDLKEDLAEFQNLWQVQPESPDHPETPPPGRERPWCSTWDPGSVQLAQARPRPP